MDAPPWLSLNRLEWLVFLIRLFRFIPNCFQHTMIKIRPFLAGIRTMFEAYAAGILLLGICLDIMALAMLFWLAVWFKLNWRRAKLPLLLLTIGTVTVMGTIVTNRLIVATIGLGPLETMVGAERHVTLTGWDRTDYGVLKRVSDVVVLQMANNDVTDETLGNLIGMDQLKELDLNDSQITDAGLEVLAQLPALEIVRIRGTMVTDKGFGAWLAAKESLIQIDARGTAISSKSLRDWKALDKERRQFLK